MKVIVGMSGGVDSSVAAYLLKKAGYDVIGAYFEMIDTKNGFENAKRVSDVLGIPLIKVDIRKEFEREVIEDFVRHYKMGLTPNPCVMCNEKIKFGIAFEKAKEIAGNALFSTGHYAILEKNGRVRLKKAFDKTKDQSYMLWRLKRSQLANSLFPLGRLTKKEVFEIAKDIGLPVPKSESQDVCFINGKLSEFLKKYIKEKEGEIILTNGKVIGTHGGVWFYTVGQRSGLGISFGEPLYVVRTDVKSNRIIVGRREECFFKFAELTDTNFIERWDGKETKLTGKVRYKAKEKRCVLKKGNGKIIAEFAEKQFAITAGQSLVFYRGDYVFGGGIIKRAY